MCDRQHGEAGPSPAPQREPPRHGESHKGGADGSSILASIESRQISICLWGASCAGPPLRQAYAPPWLGGPKPRSAGPLPGGGVRQVALLYIYYNRACATANMGKRALARHPSASRGRCWRQHPTENTFVARNLRFSLGGPHAPAPRCGKPTRPPG